MNKGDKLKIEDLVQGGEKMLFSGILVSLCSIGAIIALIVMLITK